MDISFRIQVESYIDFSHALFLDAIEGMDYRRKDNGRFIKRLQQIADGGHAASKYALASIFLNDTLAGRAISAKASSEEENWLINSESFSTYDGKREADPTPQNIPLAVSQLSSASELGHAASQVELGILYETGNGVEKNLNEAYRLYSNGLELGNFEANYFLGELYLNKDFDKRNPLKAIEYLEEYAQSNPAVAGSTIGAIYLEGKDVPQDTEMALHWFKTAANAKDGKAAYLVGPEKPSRRKLRAESPTFSGPILDC